MPAGPIPGNVIAQAFGIFHGIPHEEFKAIVDSAPFGACNLLILAFVHSVEGPPKTFTAQFDNGRDNGFPNGKPPDTDLERVALVISKARALNPSIKILISLGYNDGDLPNAVKTPTQFADSVAQLAQQYGLDGFDIDFENPGDTTAEQLLDLLQALRQSLGKVTPKRDVILTITPAGPPWESVLTSFTYIIPQYYGGSVPPKDEDWYFKHLGSLDRVVYGLSSEGQDDPVSYAMPARANGAAGIYAWRFDNDDLFIGGMKMRRLMSDDRLWSATPNGDGSWQWSGPIGAASLPNFIDVSFSPVGKTLQMAAAGSDFSLWAATFLDGDWQLYDIRRDVSGGPPGFSSVACGSADQKSLQVVGLGSDGQLWLAIHNPEGNWQPTFTQGPTMTSNNFLAVSCAGTGEDLKVIVMNDAKRLWFTVWHPSGKWDALQLIDVGEGPPEFVDVDCAQSSLGLHVVAVGSDQQLWHRINGVDKSWQRVADLATGCPAQVLYATCVSTEQGLHVVAADIGYQLWHTVRNANGTWQPFKGGIGPKAPPVFVALAGGSLDGKTPQIIGVGGA